MAKTSIVFFQHGDLTRPVLKVMETKDQVVVNVRSRSNEHLTLHRKADGEILLTYSSPELSPASPDRTREKVARKLGWLNPEKHEHYVIHQPLLRNVIVEGGMDGHDLIGRRINIEDASDKRKYGRAEQILIELPAKECMIDFVLSTEEYPYSDSEAPRIHTELGDLYFRPRPDSN